MFHPRHHHFVFAFFMALFMSFLMSGVISAMNVGIPENFLVIWFHAWWTAFIIAYPSVLFVSPIVRRITNKLVRAAEHHK
ncbi:DUF2798 domain-containing protein [Thiomicrorhabdus sp.]|uniref:DUF2798 domain-containing protein n=1 Tax=Thiomicrorhabdus sp. TaxID=2039724 RepID=UPI0029C865C7|nr:DUF2798 domain-containing protein [Thiomicrorhabdus sp.]